MIAASKEGGEPEPIEKYITKFYVLGLALGYGLKPSNVPNVAMRFRFGVQ